MTPTSINLVTYTTSFLHECSKKLNVRKEEFIDFKSTYYSYLYKLKNHEICTQTVLIDILKKSLNYYNNVLFHSAIDYQNIEKILLASFEKNNIKENSTFIFCNRMIMLEEKSKSLLVNNTPNFPEIKKEILKSAISLLNDFAKYSEKKTIPWELFATVMYDAHKYYIANKKFIDNGTAVFKRYAIKSLITFKFEQYNREVTSRILISPPCKNDILMQLHSSTDYSLPLLCHYFGHNAWYSQFSPFFTNDTVVNNKLYQFLIEDK